MLAARRLPRSIIQQAGKTRLTYGKQLFSSPLDRTFGSTSVSHCYDENAYLKPLLGSSARVVQLDSVVQAFYNIQVEMLPEGAATRPPAGQFSSAIVCLCTLKHIWHYLVLFPGRNIIEGRPCLRIGLSCAARANTTSRT
jgi:hypothetical protein